MGHTATEQPESTYIYDDVFPLIERLCDEPRPPMRKDGKIRVGRFQPYLRAFQYPKIEQGDCACL